jgi:tetrapyrrole methylase family protein/MazG family protein/ATP diphosphatase
VRDLAAALTDLQSLTERLRRDCPWDREQTERTIVPHTVEEAYEVADAALAGDDAKLLDELGDLLFQVFFLALLLEERGRGDLSAAARLIHEKLVRRHPHVFGETMPDGSLGPRPAVDDAAEVLRNWERQKAVEKKDRGLLEGVPRSLPALVRAQRIGEKVGRVGFDWPDVAGSRAKVAEELSELDAAIARGDSNEMEEELGDVFFALVNLARHLPADGSSGIDAEASLRRTIDKFTDRFAYVEKKVREDLGGFGNKPTLAQMDAYWEEAKKLRAQAAKGDTPKK